MSVGERTPEVREGVEEKFRAAVRRRVQSDDPNTRDDEIRMIENFGNTNPAEQATHDNNQTVEGAAGAVATGVVVPYAGTETENDRAIRPNIDDISELRFNLPA